MVRTRGSPSRRSRNGKILVGVVGALSFARGVHAAPQLVSIVYAEQELRDVAERLASELASEGYAVQFGDPGDSSPCDAGAAARSSDDGRDRAWIRLSEAAGDRVEASICHRSSAPILRQTAARALRSEPERFALTASEALNGLRAKVPRQPVDVPAPVERIPAYDARDSASAERERTNEVFATQSTVVAASEFPPLLGVSLGASVGVRRGFAITVESFWTARAAVLENESVRVSARSAWVRFGPELQSSLGAIRFRAALLAGPAVTWATARAELPRIGTADVAVSAIASLAASLEYPRTSTAFALLATRGSTLLPAVRLALGEDRSNDFGPWLLEASVGMGLRWSAPSGR